MRKGIIIRRRAYYSREPSPLPTGQCSMLSQQHVLYAAGRLRKACDFACLLCRTTRIELVEIFGIPLVGTKLLADFLYENLDHRRDLVLFVVVAKEIHDFPVLIAHLNPFDLREVIRDIQIPIVQVRQKSIFIHFNRLAFYVNCCHCSFPFRKLLSRASWASHSWLLCFRIQISLPSLEVRELVYFFILMI